MKLALISDLHLLWNNPVCRLDDLTKTQFFKLEFVLNYCQKNSLPLLQAGDFFDSPRSYIFLSKVIDLLNKYEDVNIYAVFGGKRHDTYLYSDETRDATNLGILEKTGFITILGSEYVPLFSDKQVIKLYGASFGEDIPKVDGKKDFNVLVIHAPITDETNWGHEHDASVFLEENKDFNLILCGDIHKYFIVQKERRFIINTGPMLRKTVSEWDHSSCFIVFDTEELVYEHVEIPHELPEEVISVSHLERKDEIDEMLKEFTDQVKEQYVVTVDLVDNIRKALKKNKISNRVADIIAETISRTEDKL